MPTTIQDAPLPFKSLADRRHHIPKQRHRVTNWAAYDAGLRGRGSLTIWFTEAAIATWRAEPRTTRGGQPRYSSLAITTALTLRAVFRLALRQTEGLIGSIIAHHPARRAHVGEHAGFGLVARTPLFCRQSATKITLLREGCCAEGIRTQLRQH